MSSKNLAREAIERVVGDLLSDGVNLIDIVDAMIAANERLFAAAAMQPEKSD